MVPTVTTAEIARRIGCGPVAVWRWSRRGRFGSPVDPKAERWRFPDDGSLELIISTIRHARAGRTRNRVWRCNDAQSHLRRLNAIGTGTVKAEPEDKELAAMLLTVAAKMHERRADGLQSPAANAAWVIGKQALARSRAADGKVPVMLYQFAAQLSKEKTKENGQPEI